MFFDTTPDTSGYMIAGYAVAFGVMAIYLVSLIVRFRNLAQDQQLLESMGREKPGVPAVRKSTAGKAPARKSAGRPKPPMKKKKK